MKIVTIQYADVSSKMFLREVENENFDAIIVMREDFYYKNKPNSQPQYDDDVGLDMVNIENINLEELEKQPKIIKSGIKTYTKPSLYFEVRPRSSLHKYGLIVANSPGTIDPQYRGDIGMVLAKIFEPSKNISNNTIKSGTRLCQLTLKPYIPLMRIAPTKNVFLNSVIEVGIFYSTEIYNEWNNLLKSQRGEDGYGSTDKRNNTVV